MRNPYDAVGLRARVTSADALRLPDRRHRAEAARAAASAAFEDAWAALRPAVEREGPIACAAGCAACCHQHVAVAAVEAVAIAGALAAAPELAARAAAAAGRIGPLSAAERRRARFPCPFLEDDGRCGIYAIRPIRCRGVHSRDVEPCRQRTDRPDQAQADRAARPGPHPAFPLVPIGIADAALDGLARAQRAAGIADETLELVTALGLLLADPERMDATMAGTDDLAQARLDLAARPVAGM
jgi:hypothetical protein